MNIEIKPKGKGENYVSPTPNNTPSISAPLISSQKPNLPTMHEDAELGEGEDQFRLPNQDLVNIIQRGLGALMGKKSCYVKSLPEEVQTRINGLKGLQLKHSQLEAQFNQEVFELEKKYLEKYMPLFEERSNIINGINEPNEADIEVGKHIREEEDDDDDEEDEDTAPLTKSGEKLNGIPEFWLTILKNHPGVADLINDNDEIALRSLVDITYRFLDDEPGYALDFVFSQNKYFTNSILTKKYYYTQSPDFGEYLLDRSEGTEIDWMEDMNLTKIFEQKKQVHKVTQETRIVTNEVNLDSFFTFFSPIILPTDEDEISEEEEKIFQDAIEADYELGEEFKLKIIPHAIDWFTGKALAFDAPADTYLEDDEDDEFSEDEE